MSTFSINGSIKRGNLIISPGGLLNFLRNNQTHRLVLGTTQNNFMPVAVQGPEEEDFSYVHIKRGLLEHYLAITRHRIIRDYPLTDKSENISRLWAAPFIWESASENAPRLKEGLMFFVLFDSRGFIKKLITPEGVNDDLKTQIDGFEIRLIADIHETQRNLSYAVLTVKNNELEIGNHCNMTGKFYEQVEAFNELVNVEEIF